MNSYRHQNTVGRELEVEKNGLSPIPVNNLQIEIHNFNYIPDQFGDEYILLIATRFLRIILHT